MSKLEQLIQEHCPNGVEWKTLGDICDSIATGKLNANSMVENGKYPFFTCDAKAFSINQYAFDTEAIIISGNGSQVGHINYYKGKFNAYQRTYIVSRFKTIVNIFYVFYYMKAALRPYISLNSKKGSVPYITLPMLQNFEIPIPPLRVQEEIVRILDAFTSHAAELQAELQARREQYEYYRNKLLSFEDNSSVEWKTLGEICEKAKAIDWKSTNISFDYIDLSSVDIQKSSIGDCAAITASNAPSRAQQIVREGDILFGKTRPTLMRFAVVPKRYNEQICSTGFCVIRVNSEVCNRFVYHYLRSGKFLLYVSENQEGAGYPSITDKKIMKFTLPIPPLSEQQRIVAILDKFEALVNDLTDGLPAEIAARQEQYEYYRDKLLNFPKAV